MTNKYKVPKAMWKKWTKEGQEFYNRIMNNADIMAFRLLKTNDRPIDKALHEHENAIIHNCAFEGACAISKITKGAQ